MMDEKKGKKRKSKTNTSQQIKKEQKRNEKSNFSSLAANRSRDACHVCHTALPTATPHTSHLLSQTSYLQSPISNL
jgi:hypothetical protein